MLEQSYLGVDVGSYSIKLVEWKRGLREGEFVQCLEAQLPIKGNAEDTVAGLRHLLEEGKFKAAGIVTAIPGTRVTQRHIRLPFTGKQVPGAVRLEVEESVPVPLDRMILTHNAATIRSGQTDVLAILAPRTDVDQHLQLVRAGGLEPRHVEIEGAVLGNLARFLGAQGDAPRVFLDIGHQKTHVCLIAAGGKPLLLRAIPVAGERFTDAIAEELNLSYEDAEEYKHEHGIFKTGSSTPLSLRISGLLDQLVREALRSLQALVSDTVDPVSPAEIVLVGGSSAIPQLPEFLAQRMGFPCRVLTVPASLKGTGALAQGRAPVFAQAAALALRGSGPQASTRMDLRQEEFKFVPDLSALRPQIQYTALLLGALLLLWPLSLASQLAGSALQTRRIRAEIERVHGQVFPGEAVAEDPMKSFMDRYNETKALADHLGVTGTGASPLEMLRLISNAIPAELDVSLTDLRIEQKSIRARGFAPDAGAANQIEQALRQIEIFPTVTIGDLNRDPGGGGFTFNLTIELGA
jgi:type IV pilus assembly protein PilM